MNQGAAQSIRLEGYRQGGELIAATGTVFTTGPIVEMEFSSELSATDREALLGDLLEDGAHTAWSAPAVLTPSGFRLAIALPEATYGGRQFSLELGGLRFPLDLRNQPPVIEALEVSGVVRGPQLYFTLLARVSGQGTLNLQAMAGSGGDPSLAQYQWRESAQGASMAQFEVVLDNPLDEDFIYLAASAVDAWGAGTARRLVLPLPSFLTMSMAPSRLPYDHSVQEMVNTLPLWTAGRSRDYLALAFDPHYTMMGDNWKWLGELKDYFVPYDFAFAPLTQRLLSGLAGVQISGLREQILALERGRFVSTADTGAAGHLWRAALPEQAQATPVIIPAFAETVHTLWDHTGDWSVDTGELRPALEAQALCLDPLTSLRLRATVRLETCLGSFTPESFSEEQNLASFKDAGSFGLVWRSSGEDWMRLGWGWRDGLFGIYVERCAGGVTSLLYRDESPRFYARGGSVVLEVIDHADGIAISLNDQQLIVLEAGDDRPGVAGIWAKATQEWRPFFSNLHVEGLPEQRLSAVSHLYGQTVALKEVTDIADFLEAAPTHMETKPAAMPASGLRWGDDPDPTRVLIGANKSGKRAVWRCVGNQICLCEEQVGEPILRFWIWLDGRAQTQYELLSCVAIRRWLYVLGRSEGATKLFIVDPASPAPLWPESCLWCESAFDLPLRGVSALARSIDRTEVFIQ